MDRIEDCISFMLGKAYQHIQQEAKRRLTPYGVTPVQYALLKVLWEKDGQSGAELCERLVLDSATVTGLLDRLEKNGLLERRPDPHDRRINRLHLTETGKSLQGPLDQQMDEMNLEAFRPFTPEQVQAIQEALRLLARPAGA